MHAFSFLLCLLMLFLCPGAVCTGSATPFAEGRPRKCCARCKRDRHCSRPDTEW